MQILELQIKLILYFAVKQAKSILVMEHQIVLFFDNGST